MEACQLPNEHSSSTCQQCPFLTLCSRQDCWALYSALPFCVKKNVRIQKGRGSVWSASEPERLIVTEPGTTSVKKEEHGSMARHWCDVFHILLSETSANSTRSKVCVPSFLASHFSLIYPPTYFWSHKNDVHQLAFEVVQMFMSCKSFSTLSSPTIIVCKLCSVYSVYSNFWCIVCYTNTRCRCAGVISHLVLEHQLTM